MSQEFKPGDAVVCVDVGLTCLENGRVYTVSRGFGSQGSHIWVDEHPGTPFYVRRFKPAETPAPPPRYEDTHGFPEALPSECAPPTPTPAPQTEHAARKARPMFSGCVAYFPDFIADLADEELSDFDPLSEDLLLLALADARQEGDTGFSDARELALTLLYSLQTHLVPGKCVDLSNGLLGAFGEALKYVGYVSSKATAQHHPGKPMHWEKDKSTDHEDCLLRHLADHESGNILDSDNVLHLGKSCWRALAIGQTAAEARDPRLAARRQAQRDKAAKGER